MELKNLTKEQLQSLGLSEDEIQAILGATETSGGNALPFPLLKINYDSDLGKTGAFGYNPIRNKEGVVEEYEHVFNPPIKVRFLKSVYQYSKYDSTQNKPTVVSNIFKLKDAKKAYDLKSKKLISELKEFDDEIKFQKITLGLIYDENGESYPFIWYLKGKYLFDLNDILKPYEDAHLKYYVTINNKKQKKGSVSYYIPIDVEVEEISDKEFLKNLKQDADYIKKFDLWITSVNSDDAATTEEPAPVATDSDYDDDDVEF